MTDEELIKGLRKSCRGGDGCYREIAADRIEQLVKDVEAATHEADEADAYAWQLEAKLAKAVKALKEVTQTLVWQQFGSCRGYSENLLTPNEAETLAKAVLTELEKTE
jgi:transcriptional regulator NrdR family protein